MVRGGNHQAIPGSEVILQIVGRSKLARGDVEKFRDRRQGFPLFDAMRTPGSATLRRNQIERSRDLLTRTLGYADFEIAWRHASQKRGI